MHTEMSARELREHLTAAHGVEVANAMMARLQPDERSGTSSWPPSAAS